MTLEEKGIYMELLLYLFTERKPIKDSKHVSRICGIDPRTSARLWAKIGDKFTLNQHGSTHELVTKILNNSGRIKGLNNGAYIGATPAQEKEKEKEVNNKKNNKKKSAEYSDEFEQVWSAYPKRPGNSKTKAFDVYQKLLRKHSFLEILSQVEKYRKYCDATNQDQAYIKHTATFLGPSFDPECNWEYRKNENTRVNNSGASKAPDYPTRQKGNLNDYV